MSILSIILIFIWLSLIYEGVYCIVKGHFHKEANRVDKHEPNAYRKWVRISGVIFIICALINGGLSFFDIFADAFDWKYVILCFVVVAITIVIVSIIYRLIVKSADVKAGIVSEFDKIDTK